MIIICILSIFLFTKITKAFQQEAGIGKNQTQPRLVCSHPYVLESDVCVFTQYSAPELHCQNKLSTLINGHCTYVEEVESINHCPDGVEFDGKHCKIMDIIDPTLVCPKGYVYSSIQDRCFSHSIGKVNLKCPDSYVLKRGSCEKIYSTPATPNCPTNYVVQAVHHGKQHNCIMVEKIEKEASCPHGYKLEGVECIQIVSDEPIPDCPLGYEPNGRSICSGIRSGDSEIFCPSGMLNTIASGRLECLVTDVLPPSPTCKHGFNLEGNICVKIDTTEAHMSCPSGFDIEDDQCARYIRDKPHFVCPELAVESDGNCQQLIESAPLSKCPPGMTLAGSACNRTLTTKPTKLCPSNSTSRNGLCYKMMKIPAESICEYGGKLDGTKCYLEVTMPAHVSCKDDGSLSGNTCLTVITEKPVFKCPRGSKQHGEQCQVITEETAEQICQTGSSPRANRCQMIHRSPPKFSCPSGFQLDQRTGYQPSCTKYEYTDPLHN